MRLIKNEEFLSSNRVRDEVSKYLLGGGSVIFPTDTLYGLGADIRQAGAVEKLMSLKGREWGKPVPLFIDSLSRIEEVFIGLSPLGRKLLTIFWPGKLTVVSRARKHIANIIGSKDGTVGVRLPDSRVALSVAGLCGGIITGTSANKSGGGFPLTIAEVARDFRSEEVLVLDGGDLPPSAGSTVIMIDEDVLEVLREGDISRKEIFKMAEEFENG